MTTEVSLPPQDTAAATAPAACRNCGAIASGNYCSHCGQSTDVHVPKLAEFLHEFISHHIAFEGTLVASVKRLLLSPGGLTLDYFIGRRARYVAPLRLYLTFNVIFFLAVQLVQALGDGVDGDARKALASLSNSDAREVAAEIQKEINNDQTLTPEQRRLAIEKFQLLQKSALNFHVAAPPAASTPATSSGDHTVEPGSSGSVPAPAGPVPFKPGISFSINQDSPKSGSTAEQPGGTRAAGESSSSGVPLADIGDAGSKDEDHEDDLADARRDIMSAIHSDLKTPQVAETPTVLVTSQPRRWQQFEDAIIPAWVDLHMPSFRRRLDQVPNRKPGEFVNNAIHFAPYTLLLLLPICAMLLQISFIGCGRRYVEHLVAALHGHTFLFIALLLFLPVSGLVALILVLAAMLHMTMALSRIYGSKGIGLMFRLGILSVSYTIAFMFATAGEFVLSILA